MFVCNNYGVVVAKIERLVPIELYFQNPNPQVKTKSTSSPSQNVVNLFSLTQFSDYRINKS